MTRQTNSTRKHLAWLLIIPLALACNLLSNTPEPTPIPIDTPVMLSPSAMPPPQETAVPTPIPPTTEPTGDPTPEPPTSGPAVLPAPLYFLNTSGQIMRLEADGLTLSQITAEPQPILDFDVSQTDGRLIYVSDNTLIETDSLGNGRIVKITGGPIDENESIDFVTKYITAPRFSPDGSQIAFGLNGINTIPAGTATEYQVVQPSDPYPDINNPGANTEDPIRFYSSAEWSPDGTKLLVEYSYFPESGGLAIKNLSDGTLVELTNPTEGITCCNWAWTADSLAGYVASDLIAYGAPGLVRFDASTGLGTTIIKGLPPVDVEPGPENPIRLFKSAYPDSDGFVLAFVATLNGFDGFSSAGVYTMQRVAPDGTITAVRSDTHPIWEVLWADDGSGAIIVDTLFNQRYPPTGPMRWLPTDGGPALNLPANGSLARWGGPTTAVSSTANPTEADFTALEAQALTDFNIELINDGLGIEGLHHGRFNLGDSRSLWYIHTTGLRDHATQKHTVGIYAFENGTWQQLAQNVLPDFEETDGIPGPDFMAPGSVQQTFIEPTNGWLSVEGGIGAHGGTIHILRFDGQSLTVEAENSNGSPVAGRIEDINGDGRQEVLLDLTDYYIFSYAAGVRLINFDVLHWDGTALVPAELTRLENNSAANTLNNEAINYTEGELWNVAQTIIARAREAGPDDETIRWNAAIINTIADARRNANSSFPIMDWVFYGDYDIVVENMRGYPPAELFTLDSPLIVGTSAQGSESLMAEQIQSFTSAALTVQPNFAAAHFLRGWATYLLNPNDPAALTDIQQAATLAPDDPFYADAAAYLQSP